MKSMEERLRQSLQRKDPDPGFTERVLSRVRSQPEEPGNGTLRLFARPSRWLAAAAIVVFVLSAGAVHRQRERKLRAEGERAKAQLLQALQITSEKLNVVLKKVNATKEAS
jgi:hypothetical protein